MELPTLHTDRLTLRALRPSDAARVAELAGAREIARNTESIPHPYSEEDAEAFIEQSREDASAGLAAGFAVQPNSEDALVGMVGIHPEPQHDRARLGYWIGVDHWNRGYATEAAAEALRWAFEDLGVGRVYARCFARNPASRRVLRKLGMKQEGVLRRHFRKWGELVDVEVYGILRDEL